MINVSAGFKTAISSSMRTVIGKLEIYFNGENNSPEVLDRSTLIDMGILEEAAADSSNPLGVVSSNELTATLHNPNGLYTISNAESPYFGKIQHSLLMKPYLGVDIGNGEVEYVPMGVFWSDDWNSPGDAVETRVTAHDILYKLGRLDTPYIRVQCNMDIKLIFKALFYALGLADNDFLIDPYISCILPYAWLPEQTVKQTLQELCTLANCSVSTTRYGKIYVRSNTSNTNIVDTLTDTDQIITATNEQTYNSLENQINLTYNLIQRSDVVSLLELDNLQLTNGTYSVAKVNFQNNPVLKVSYVQVEGSDTAVVSNLQYDSEQISFDISDSASSTVKVIVMGVYLVTNQSSLKVQDDVLVNEMGPLPISVDSALIQQVDMANTIGQEMLRVVARKNSKYVLSLRGNPALEILDSIAITDAAEKINGAVVTIRRQQFVWDGSLSVDMEATILIGTAVSACMRRIVHKVYTENMDTKLHETVGNHVTNDTKRRIGYRQTVSYDTERLVHEVISVVLDTLRKVAGMLITFDTLRRSANVALKHVDTVRKTDAIYVVHEDTKRNTMVQQSMEIDTVRKLDRLCKLDADTRRKLVMSTTIDDDAKRLLQAIEHLSADTLRKTAIVAGRFDAKRVVNLSTHGTADSKRQVVTKLIADSDTNRSVHKTDVTNIDTVRRLIRNNLVKEDTMRELRNSKSSTVDMKRTVDITENLISDTKRITTFLQNRYVLKTDGVNGVVKYANAITKSNLPHNVTLYLLIKIDQLDVSASYRPIGVNMVFNLGINSGYWRPFVSTDADDVGDGAVPSELTVPVVVGKWQRIAFQLDFDKEYGYLYTDGILGYTFDLLSAAKSLQFSVGSSDSNQLTIGGLISQSEIDRPLSFEIADLQLYNISMPGNIYPAIVDDSNEHLILHCTFDANSGNEANKASNYTNLYGLVNSGVTRIIDNTRPYINSINADTKRLLSTTTSAIPLDTKRRIVMPNTLSSDTKRLVNNGTIANTVHYDAYRKIYKATTLNSDTQRIVGNGTTTETIAYDTNRKVSNGDNKNPTVGEIVRINNIDNVTDNIVVIFPIPINSNIEDNVVYTPIADVSDNISIHMKGIVRYTVTDSVAVAPMNNVTENVIVSKIVDKKVTLLDNVEVDYNISSISENVSITKN